MERFNFTFPAIKKEYSELILAGYSFITCEEYALTDKSKLPSLVVVNRIDVDLSVKKAERIATIFNELGIKGTFFFRLHAPEYNLFSFENYRILKSIVEAGHEIGYHSEVIDQAAIWNESAEDCLRRDLTVLSQISGAVVRGVASHGGMTGLNNLDFWKIHKPKEFNLLYEAYDTEAEFDLFNHSLYVSDSEWIRWKCYQNGKIIAGDQRSPAEHAANRPPVIYLLIHPDSYFDRHFYEA